MAKYIVTNGVTVEKFEEKNHAIVALLSHLIWSLAGEFDNPIGMRIEEIEDEEEKPKDVPELIPDYEAAQNYLKGIGEKFMVSDHRFHAESIGQIDAFAQLLILCRAWNKADNWEPDWSNENQEKWFPMPYFANGDLHLVAAGVSVDTFSSFVFKTKERAIQFGKKFINLFKQLYGIKEGE